ncbi:MAG: flagellar basal body-associated FliL family protein [Bacteriovoracia bacterium]
MADESQIIEAGLDSPTAGGSKGSANPFVLVVLILNLIAMGTIAYFQYSILQKEKNRPTVRDLVKSEMAKLNNGENQEGFNKVTDPSGKLFPLDPFTANLAQGDGPRRYVRMTVVLKFSEDSNEGEFKARSPQIRDSVISILNSKRPEDLLRKEGKQYLKEEIKAAINAFLIDGSVIDVFYNSFQIN